MTRIVETDITNANAPSVRSPGYMTCQGCDKPAHITLDNIPVSNFNGL